MIKNRVEKNITNQELGIYIHIPFCVRKCEYCDFLSGAGNNQMKKAYVDALLKEIEAAAAMHQGYIISTVFFGGGTPSILLPEEIRRIMEKLRALFPFKESFKGEDSEITIEANPGTLNREKLLIYKQAGINRLSIGLQTANNKELVTLGRIHTWEEFLESYHMARDLGFANINVDLMSGLPGQTLQSLEDTLTKVISLNPEHISAYSLIIEEGTPFYHKYYTKESEGNLYEKEVNSLPDEDTERTMYDLTNKILKEHGYGHYEISNYSKPGFDSRHNLAYWERKSYLGFGIGAASLINHHRFSNTGDISKYIKYSSRLNSIRQEVTSLLKKEEIEEFMFLGLRMMKGISINDFYINFETSFFDIYGEVSEKLIREGLLEVSDRLEYTKENNKDARIRLTKKGIDVSNYVMAEFLLD